MACHGGQKVSYKIPFTQSYVTWAFGDQIQLCWCPLGCVISQLQRKALFRGHTSLSWGCSHFLCHRQCFTVEIRARWLSHLQSRAKQCLYCWRINGIYCLLLMKLQCPPLFRDEVFNKLLGLAQSIYETASQKDAGLPRYKSPVFLKTTATLLTAFFLPRPHLLFYSSSQGSDFCFFPTAIHMLI